MSVAPRILEGTWEEILQHAPELAGHRLVVKILDLSSASPASVPNLDANNPAFDPSPGPGANGIEEFIRWANSLPPAGPWDDSRDTIYEHLLK
jgi:hypothetical protein